VFANFAQALAEGRSQAQAASLPRTEIGHAGRRLRGSDHEGPFDEVPATAVRKADLYRVEAGQIVRDGEGSPASLRWTKAQSPASRLP